jgi:hypothetical protein
MAQLLTRDALDQGAAKNARGERAKAVKILAKSIFRELRASGYQPRELVALSTELLELITSEIRPDSSDTSK